MSLRFRTLATMSLSTLVGLGMLAVRAATENRASADEFQPIKEAEMPKGFPTYTPVGQIEIKEYPAYRKASASGPAEFWTLFQHINQNNVTMTAAGRDGLRRPSCPKEQGTLHVVPLREARPGLYRQTGERRGD